MAEFLMPSLGADMETGTLIEWLKEPGESVSRGDIIAVVETQKGAIEIEVFDDGVLESRLVEIGRPVPVGTPLALISTAESDPSVPVAQPMEKPAHSKSSTIGYTDDVADTRKAKPDTYVENVERHRQRISPDQHRQKISPAARRLVAELGLDITSLTGSGPQGAIILEDVRSHRPTQSNEMDSASGGAETLEPSGKPTGSGISSTDMRRAIAAAMARSKREIPHYYLSHTIDLSPAEKWLSNVNADRDPSRRILMSALLLKAVALAAVKYPEFNGHFREDEFHPMDPVHAGMAINIRGGGLVAPAIHNSHELKVDRVMIRMRDLIARVRQGQFRASELADPTITVSSLGDRGVSSLYGVIYPPQVAIVGFGTPCMRPWVADNDQVQARLLVEATLAADHRVSDGHRGALFLRHIQKKLEHPGDL